MAVVVVDAPKTKCTLPPPACTAADLHMHGTARLVTWASSNGTSFKDISTCPLEKLGLGCPKQRRRCPLPRPHMPTPPAPRRPAPGAWLSTFSAVDPERAVAKSPSGDPHHKPKQGENGRFSHHMAVGQKKGTQNGTLLNGHMD